MISAFNFPVAVWAWNAMIGLVCGDPIVWKPSEKTPLSRDRVPGDSCRRVIAESPDVPPAISQRGDRRRRRRPGAGRVAAAAARLGDRLRADGPRGRANGRRAAGPHRCWNSAATTA